jgi:peptide deformylase
MILPIYTYGHEVLRKKCQPIDTQHPELATLIENMFETMYASQGVGLAAPQIGLGIRMFIVDTTQWEVAESDEKIRQVFINPVIEEEWDEPWKFEEGCLSIPGIREGVTRHALVKLQFYDADFTLHHQTYKGMAARVIQHEYDHIEGILFTDKIHPLRKKLLQGKLRDMSKGIVKADYKIKPPKK